MSEEIDESIESDQSKLFSQLNNRDTCSTFSVRFSVEDVLAFARGLDGKYAEQKESIRLLQFNSHVGLPADDMDMSEIDSFLRLKTTEASYRLHNNSFEKRCFPSPVKLIRIIRYTSKTSILQHWHFEMYF